MIALIVYSCSTFFSLVNNLVVTCIADPEGIANAQKSLGLGQEEKARRVR